SILNRCSSSRLPFTWTINPYRGCEFGCHYCYARYTHEFLELREGRDFERTIFAKQNAAWLLRRDLRRVRPGEKIAIGTATDPYQPAERRYGVTREVLEELARHQGLDLGLVTKSDLVVRDSGLLCRIAERNRLHVCLTITSLNTKLARILEPRAPRPDLRLEALRQLSRAGIEAGVMCAPVLPGINDAPRQLEALVEATVASGGKFMAANPLFLKPCAAQVFLPFLEKYFPELAESYRRRYRERAYLPDSYQRHISRLLSSLKRKHGLGRERYLAQTTRFPVETAGGREQLALFAG
ncbi:MAG: radical SAM protein, partial [Terriglobales bacterium]